MISPCKIIDNFLSLKQKTVICCIFVAFFAFSAASQALRNDYKAYIERYKAMALQHESAFGIPASITLAQGLLESGAGRSGLAINGNNHFGIKDFSWHGEVVCYGDSTNRTCYRKYGCAEDSFLDHARFLKGKRYGKLYELDVTDYRGWAEGLRECGYAEDPLYPQKLINIIEQYQLHLLSTGKPIFATADDPNATAEEKAYKKEQEKLKKEAIRQARAAERKSLERRKKEKHEREKRERADRYAQRQAQSAGGRVAATASQRASATRYASADND